LTLAVLSMAAACGGVDDGDATGGTTTATSTTTTTSASSSGAPSLELFDAHIHVMPNKTEEQIVALGKKAGFIGMAVLGPVFADGNPDYAHPFYFPNVDKLYTNAGEIDKVEAAIKAGARGIGEMPIKHFPSGKPPVETDYPGDAPNFVEVYKLADGAGIPVNVHIDGVATLEVALAAAEKEGLSTVFIWSHAGDAQAKDVRALMDKYPNLYADLACRTPYYERGFPIEEQRLTDTNDTETELDDPIKESWRKLFEDHPTRFMFGSDVGPPGREEILTTHTVPYFLNVLSQLEPATARGIASENAKAVLGID